MDRQLLAGLSAPRFLARHWQKKPLLARGAVRGFSGLLSPRALMRLAGRDDVQSRIVEHRDGRWLLRHGPFSERDFRRMPRSGWTVLVQELNHHLPEARDLLARFDFIPHARLDDLMVSYAPDGGGVGPHFDSYDVFLLQGMGRRRWRISAQRDRELVPDAPLRILRRFVPGREWVLESGDMLYLPPRYAHDGIAVGECMTYSVGFRAPSFQELGSRFLAHLDDGLDLPGIYSDPGLRSTAHPGSLGDDLIDATRHALDRIRWDRAGVARFLGCYLTEPKPHVFFSPPRRPLARAAFDSAVAMRGVALDLRSQMLFRGREVFLNGEAHRVGGEARACLARLADERSLDAGNPPGEAAELLYQWYRAGYIGLRAGS